MNLPEKNLLKVKQRLLLAAQQARREADTVRLIAVSKTQPAEAVEQAYLAGQMEFGENYLQEAVDKITKLAHLTAIKWHFIGSIQSNKTKLIAQHFDWVHSVDRLKLAQRLSAQRNQDQAPLNICLQVNVSQEPSKSGVALTDVPALASQIAGLNNIRLRGLMAIPLNTSDSALQHQYFKQLHDCLLQLKQIGLPLDTLSMGMSGDMEIAIAEGATMIRVGTAIFGDRQKK
ncbi:MAG: YggS family pyridoxal phosphate-dependent enzyme [Gammaproteobacteria bacterium]|nr:YggS family pyridoxal phosphate-dependent enzyme [Gammaproteobacteria bacterium]